MDKIIIKKIKTLRKIKPSTSWLLSQRSFLLSEISKTSKIPISIPSPFFGFSKFFKPVFATAFIAIILISSLGTIGLISAAQNSLPGDSLYAFKTMFEQTQMTFTPGEENKARLSIKFVNQRIDEFSQIVDKSGKKQDIEKTAQRFTEQLVAVQESMNKLKERNSQKAAEIAKIIDSQVPAYKETLTKTNEQLASIVVDKALEELTKIEERAEELIKSGTDKIGEEDILVPVNEQLIESESIPFEKISE